MIYQELQKQQEKEFEKEFTDQFWASTQQRNIIRNNSLKVFIFKVCQESYEVGKNEKLSDIDESILKLAQIVDYSFVLNSHKNMASMFLKSKQELNRQKEVEYLKKELEDKEETIGRIRQESIEWERERIREMIKEMPDTFPEWENDDYDKAYKDAKEYMLTLLNPIAKSGDGQNL